MKNNPYTITFGKEPKQIIPRAIQEQDIIDTFCADEPNQQVYMITGPRGCGKTVFMTEVTNKIAKQNNWIVVELNPERNLLEALVSKLNSENYLANAFRKAKINLSLFGFGVEINNVAPIADIETALEKMLETIQKQKRRLLITVDEVTSTPYMREFASAFQILLRKNLPIFLLMTGLHDNIRELQNEKSLTFLYRSPQVVLAPLNLGTISRNYQRTLGLDAKTAKEMSVLTRGYSFAFQVLGYLVWENNTTLSDSVLDTYRQYLDDYVYDKVWSELSATDRKVAYGIATTLSSKISAIRETLGMTTNQFNPYRKRLIQRGILNGAEHGHVRFTLPCFEDYVSENYIEELNE